MTYELPDYLRASGCQGEIRYSWDDRGRRQVYDAELYDRLTHLSQRAVLAFAAGSAEWLVYRFDQVCDQTKVAWDLIEMAWASIAHLRYSAGPECWSDHATVQSSWEGPIEGPIRRGLMSLEAAFYPEYPTDPPQRAARVAALTTYVMSNPGAYQRWCGQVLERFEDLCSRNPSDPVGEVIPRAFVDPAPALDLGQTELLVQEFLVGLNPEANIFLCSPEEMLDEFGDALPFVGTPYRFDIKQDREQRQLWTGGHLLQRAP